jgi:hypothetical protein
VGGDAAYSVIEWDDDSGDADISEFDTHDCVIRRFQWIRQEAGVLLIELAPNGEERNRQVLTGEKSRGW